MEIWNIIVQSNTFNFVIFVILLAMIVKAAKVGSLIEKMQEKVRQFVEESDKAKENSVQELKKAEKDFETVGKEVKTIMDDADLHSIRLSRKILADAKVQSDGIIFNADKINDANGKKIISNLSVATALASVELAKKHIVNTLSKKPQYHAKFIEDSINELDGFKF